jgi:hypothetical protein
LDRVGIDLHRLAEARSLALHEAVADAIRADPRLIENARERVIAWRSSGHLAPAYADAWLAILGSPLEDVCRAITQDTEAARALRQTTPFAGAIDPRTRWRIWDEVREQMGANDRGDRG